MSQKPVSDVVFTPAVKGAQARLGSRRGYEHMEIHGGFATAITEDLTEFIAQRDSFYLGTASAAGRPYIQHRGGPAGFLKVLDETTLAFADFSGNRQYISMGNLTENDQATIFLMDYANRRRIKIWGRGHFVEDDTTLLKQVRDPGYAARPERVLVFEVEAWDSNCPQHIPRLYNEQEALGHVKALKERISALEARLRVQEDGRTDIHRPADGAGPSLAG